MIEALEKESVEIAEKLSKDFPDNPDALALLGKVYNNWSDTSKGAELWEQALKRNPNCPELYDALAMIALRKGECEKAAKLCRAGLAQSSRMPALHCHLAEALHGLGKPEEAAAALEQAVKIFPQDGQTHYLLGKSYALTNQYEKAKASYELAVKLQPGNLSAHYGLAIACARQGLADQAKRSMEQYRKLIAEKKSIERKPASTSGDEARCRRVLATICADAAAVYAKAGRGEKAEELLRKGVGVDAKYTRCRIQLALLLVSSNRAPEAIGVCRELIALEPNDSGHYLALARIYARLRRFDDARMAAREAVDIDPDNEDCRRTLLELQGRK